jgi:hypothetical protein
MRFTSCCRDHVECRYHPLVQHYQPGIQLSGDAICIEFQFLYAFATFSL